MIVSLVFAAALGYAHPEQLVDTAWVAAHARDGDVRVLDLRRSGYDAGHVPEALWLDPESIRDPANAPAFMLSPAAFAAAMGRLGVSSRTRVIVYDDRGGLLAARLWWMYCWVGHRSAVDLFALRLISYPRLKNYLGSWEEWSQRMDLPTQPFRK